MNTTPDPQIVREFCDDMATDAVLAHQLQQENAEQLRQENADLRAKLAAAVSVVATAYPTTADEMNAVIRQIGEVTHVPAGRTIVWSGYDDDERGFPLFATREGAQQYVEQQFRKDCANWGNPPESIGEITWSERKAYTDAHGGRVEMFDLECEIGGDGWVVHALEVHPDAMAAILAETADAVPLGSRVRINRPGFPYDRMAGLVVALHPYGEAGKVGVMVDGREGVAVFPVDDVTVLPREAVASA